MADIGYGTVIQRFSTEDSTAGQYNTIGGVFAVDGVDISRDDVEHTHYASTEGYREYIPGLKEPGEIAITMNFLSTDQQQQRLLHSTNAQSSAGAAGTTGSLVASFWQPVNAGTPRQNFRLVGPNNDYWQFSAYVKGITQAQPIDDRRTWTATLKLSGPPTFGHTTN